MAGYCPICGAPTEAFQHCCASVGPRYANAGAPRCVLPPSHAGPHRAHESWGEVTW
jgi:hypothetical protein